LLVVFPGAAVFGVGAVLCVLLYPTRLFRRGATLGDGDFRGDHFFRLGRVFVGSS
jgi:hypothetical protein